MRAALRDSSERTRPPRHRTARAPAGPTVEEAGPSLIVATYNVHSCVGVDRRYDPLRVAQVIAELGADIVCLQEVETRRHARRPVDQGHLLGEAAALAAITPPPTGQRGRFGNAILTRLPVLEVRHIDLSVDGYEPRSAIDADVDAGGRVLRVVATHFGLRAGERRQQTQRLLATLAEVRPTDAAAPILMMGDLNEWRGRRGGIPALERALGRAPAPRTFPAWCPILPLDRIYTGPATALRELAAHRSPLARLASDHLPLRARLLWRHPG